MRILSRYVFREILVSSFLATVLATFVIFLQGISPLVELLVRSGNGFVFLELCVLALPPVLLLSIPFGVLVGILVGLGRMSSDNELVAMRSGGISSRLVAPPVLFFATLAMLVSGACAVWLSPLAFRSQLNLRNKVDATQVTANVPPQVFQEQFTNDNTVLYVDDVKSGVGPTVWRGVFIADLTPPAERKTGLKNQPFGPKITMAREAIAVPDTQHNRIQLTMQDQSIHEAPVHTYAPRASMALQQNPQEKQRSIKPYREMLTKELAAYIKAHPKGSQENIDARVELNGRFALPFACIMLALVGIPLGASSRRGGRSGGYVWAILLAFFCYYLAYISLTHAASQSHKISPELATWLPDALFGLAGLLMISRMEIPGDRDLIGSVRMAFAGAFARLSGRISKSRETGTSPKGARFVVLQLMDSYVLSGFVTYFVLWLAAFVTMSQVYNFFELLGDVVKNQIPLGRVLTYHFFLTPLLIYDTLPMAVLLAVLVTFGVMTKNNEVTAFKACGISVRRLGLPVLLMSGAITAALFAADYSWIPQANQMQDAIHNEIKGRPRQTYLHPDRKWVFHKYRIFYYRGFDVSEKMMVEPFVFEIDPKTFRLVREISANRARWQANIQQWVWEQGTARDICGVDECKLQNFTVTSFPEITEVPDDFLIAVKQNQQMNYDELGQYVQYLQERGFDTVKLRVQYYKKFAVPAFALIMALISVPFGFLVGNRGAMTGIGVSIAIAMAYLGVDRLFEQMGNVNYLPAAVAAWTPDALFSLAGLYLLLRMRS
jgi:LPS export ABC transporter permease LptG/LPS export ABC transporter permease LptF